MEDSKMDELIKSQCYQCVIDSSSISSSIYVFVPFGALEQFVTMFIRSGHSVTVVSRESDMIF